MPEKISKDHYVPQVYLNAFSIQNSKVKNLHIYQYMDDRIAQPSIKDVACERHFYTIKNKKTGEQTREVDKFLTQVEDNASIPLKKIISDRNFNITEEERERLSIFFAVLAVRTPGFIKSQESMREEAIKEFQSISAIDKNYFRKQIQESGIQLSDKQLEELRQFALKKDYKIKFPDSKGYFIGTGLEMSMKLAEGYYKIKQWHLLITRPNNYFITSDNPISIYRPKHIPPIYNAGYGNGTLIIPLSPNLALLLRDMPLAKKIIEINDYFVTKINKNIIRFSDNFIYSHKKSTRIHNLFKKTKRKQFQRTETQRVSWAPFVAMGMPPVPEEIIK